MSFSEGSEGNIFADLAKPFRNDEVKTRPQGGRQLSYVTARTVMNRLDEVVGPAGWWDDYDPREDSVICRLTIRLPDGTTLTKVDAGGAAGMSDPGDDEKSAFSDAFKRAAVKFGVGRYLYRDGTPNFEQTEHHAKHHNNDTGHGSGAYAKPDAVKAYAAWAKALADRINAKWLDDNTGPGGVLPDGLKDLMSEWQLTGHLLKWARAEGLVNAPEKPAASQRDKFAAVGWERNRAAFEEEARRYAIEKRQEARAALAAAASPAPAPTGDDHDSDVWPEGRD